MNNDGGPAFPVTPEYRWCDTYGVNECITDSGMSLRDYAEIEFTKAWITAVGKVGLSNTGVFDEPSELLDYVMIMGKEQADLFIKGREDDE